MSTEPAADPRDCCARGLAALRIFVGVIAFTNGLAKLFSFREIEIGPYFGTLVDRPEARPILDFEVNQRGGGTDLPLLPTLVNDIILPSYDVQQWLLTFTELGTGALLHRRPALARRRADRLRPALLPPARLLLQRPLRVRAAARVGAAADPRTRPRRPRLGTRRPPRPQPRRRAMALLRRLRAEPPLFAGAGAGRDRRRPERPPRRRPAAPRRSPVEAIALQSQVDAPLPPVRIRAATRSGSAFEACGGRCRQAARSRRSSGSSRVRKAAAIVVTVMCPWRTNEALGIVAGTTLSAVATMAWLRISPQASELRLLVRMIEPRS